MTNRVRVTGGALAKSSPTFLIRQGDRLFVTVAVIEYSRAQIQERYGEVQAEGVRQMQHYFAMAEKTYSGDTIQAYPLSDDENIGFSLGPPGVGTDPPGVGTKGVGTEDDGVGGSGIEE